MNTSTIKTGPDSAASSDADPYFILARINSPEIPSFLPADNRTGATLLGCLLEAKYQLAGLAVEYSVHMGELNHSLYVMKTTELARALDCVRTTLAETALLPLSEIGWFDARENILRIIHPKERQELWPSEEIEAGARDCAKIEAEMKSFVEELRKLLPPSNSPGDPGDLNPS